MLARRNRRTISRIVSQQSAVEMLESRTLLTGVPHLQFFSQPAASIINTPVSPAITVAVEDDTNTIISSDTSNVTLAVASPTGGTISGTATVAAVNGIATFSDVFFTAPGFYTLSASDGADTPTTSNQFTIIAAVATVTLTSSNLQPIVGDSVTLTANVSGSQGVPTGSVIFFDGSTQLGTANLSQGATSLATTFPLGQSTITATYSGDTTYGAANSSASITETVTPTSILQTTVTGSLPQTVIAGQKANIRQKILVTNLGNSLNGQFTGTVFLGQNQVIDATSIQLPLPLIKKLKLPTRKHATLSLKLKSVPATVPAGIYHILVNIADPSGGTTLTASAGTINVVAPTIDLSGQFKKTPATAKLGRPISVSVILNNAGNVPASGMLPITLTATIAGQTPTTIILPPRKINVKPGKPASLSLNHVISLSVAGAYTFTVQLDPANTLGDVNLANNQFVSPTIVVG